MYISIVEHDDSANNRGQQISIYNLNAEREVGNARKQNISQTNYFYQDIQVNELSNIDISCGISERNSNNYDLSYISRNGSNASRVFVFKHDFTLSFEL